ncbi:MAG: NAD-binding protein, partial [Gammaproteobacteria bacterium]|nr:NAD-binding protein [Gammaproteobacteria bacterium]
MDAVILGAGNVGFQLAKQLIDEKKDIVLIEKDPEKAKHANNLLDCMVINEQGNNIETLKKASISKARYFISVTDSDEINMIACGMVSSEFQVP